MTFPTTALLLVDDDEFVRGALERALGKTGAFTIIAARNGQEALQLLGTHHVDAVLTDLQMPGMNGVAMLGQMLERGLRVPVAVMTGQVIDTEHARKLHDYGIAAVFSKPVNVGTLADELQRALDPESVGHIRGITLFGLLQLLEVERKSALVVVRASDREGRLYFDSGSLTHAHSGDVIGSPAAYAILSWHDPSVEIFYKRRSWQRTISEPLQHVMMEAARLIDEDPRRGRAGDDGRLAPPASVAPAESPEGRLLRECLASGLADAGARGVALVDLESGMILAEAGGGGDAASLDAVAAVLTEVTRAQLRGMRAMGLTDELLGFTVNLGKQHFLLHLIFAGTRYLLVVLDRGRANVGMARHQLSLLASRITT